MTNEDLVAALRTRARKAENALAHADAAGYPKSRKKRVAAAIVLDRLAADRIEDQGARLRLVSETFKPFASDEGTADG